MKPIHYKTWNYEKEGMIDYIKERQGELVITLFTAIACLVLLTLTYDDYGYFLTAMAAGQFSNFNFIDLHFLGYIGVNLIYKFLYHLLPDYNWMGIGILGFTLLALYVMLRSIKKILLPLDSSIWLLLSGQLLFTFFFLENILILSHTRFSLLFCGLSLFNLAFTSTIRKRDILLNSSLFLLGMLHRPESSMGMLALVSLGYLIFRFDVKYLLQRIALPALFTVVLFIIMAANWSHTKVFMEKIEPEIEYKMMDKRIVPLSAMKTAQDSVKYEAAEKGMWFDPSEMNPAFLRSLLLPGINLGSEHVNQIFFHVFSFYAYYSFIPFFVCSLLLLCLFRVNRRTHFYRIILFQIGVFCLIYALDFNGQLVSGRHFLNLQLISLLITIRLFFKGLTFEDIKTIKTPVILSLILVSSSTFIAVSNYKTSSDKIKHNYECSEMSMKKIEGIYSNRIIASNMSGVYLMDHSFSFRNRNFTNNRWILYDAFTFSLIPEYQLYLNKQCHCNSSNPTEFYSWLAKQGGLYLAKEKSFDITERYMLIIHHLPISFLPSGNLIKSDCLSNTELKNVDIRKVLIK